MQPAYQWPASCRLDVTKPQAYWELMNSSYSGIYADLLFALRDLELGRELQGGQRARGHLGWGSTGLVLGPRLGQRRCCRCPTRCLLCAAALALALPRPVHTA